MTEKSSPKPILGYTDIETVKLDLDNSPFNQAKNLALKVMKSFRLKGFIILKSSKKHYHIFFDYPVSWAKNMRILAWASLESNNVGLVKYLQMQCIKETSTLRISPKGTKPCPRIVYRHGEQGNQIREFLQSRTEIKRLSQEMSLAVTSDSVAM